MSSQAHILSVPLHCLEVNGFCVLSRTENSGPAPAHRVPSVHLQEKKNQCFALPCSSQGWSFPWLFTLFVSNQICLGNGPAGISPAPGPRWGQRCRIRPRVCDGLSQLWMCLVLSVLPLRRLWTSLFPSTSSRPIPTPPQGLLCSP